MALFAHGFPVYIPTRRCLDDTQRQTIRRIVEMAKPAHTDAHVEIAEPLFRIGVQARVGVNTLVGRYPEGVTLDVDELGTATVLGPSEAESLPPTLTIGVRSRIGSSTLID